MPTNHTKRPAAARTAPEAAPGICPADRAADGHVLVEPAPLVFVVPMPPTLTNSGAGRSRHWRVLEREKQAYWLHLAYIDHVCSMGSHFGDAPWEIPEPPDAPFARVSVTSDMVLGGAMDDDNAVARHKWLLDWLVANGYLASDRRTCVRWAAFPAQRVTRKEPARITLTLTPVTEQAS